MVRKLTPGDRPGPSDTPVPVTVEPRPGVPDQAVVDQLQKAAATEVAVLAPGYITACLAPSRFAALEPVAVVQRKARKQMH